MKNFSVICYFLLAVHTAFYPLAGSQSVTEEGKVVVKPEEYPGALANPLMGFTNRGWQEDNPWATLMHFYIPWNSLENHVSDGMDKIREYLDQNWRGIEARNMKVIPRVYLEWPNRGQYWPADMVPGDYSSQNFRDRVVRLIERLGQCWDRDPRIAHIEMGIIGKWGEHHSPGPSAEMQKILGRAFRHAFPHKKVLVRHPWEFTDYQFGIYWDSWAHADQMDNHGGGIEKLRDRWKTEIIGGEVAYDWGRYEVHPGRSPTETVSDPVHRRYLIDTIRRLHCTQLRWVSDYDQENPAAVRGAAEIQRAFGYRFVIKEVIYPAAIQPARKFYVSFSLVNEGSAPFYYPWPVELSLVKDKSENPLWKTIFQTADIRNWLPGDHWNAEKQKYERLPQLYQVSEEFMLPDSISTGTYILCLAVCDPAGENPSLRFAIQNYFIGGRHPIGYITVGDSREIPKLDFPLFDDPAHDRTLYYKSR